MELGLEVFRNVYISFKSNNLDFSNDMVIVIHIQLMKFIYKILTDEYILHIDSLSRILQITFIMQTYIIIWLPRLRLLLLKKIYTNIERKQKIVNIFKSEIFYQDHKSPPAYMLYNQ